MNCSASHSYVFKLGANFPTGSRQGARHTLAALKPHRYVQWQCVGIQTYRLVVAVSRGTVAKINCNCQQFAVLCQDGLLTPTTLARKGPLAHEHPSPSQ